MSATDLTITSGTVWFDFCGVVTIRVHADSRRDGIKQHVSVLQGFVK